MNTHPFGSCAIHYENVVILLKLVTNVILLVLFSVAVEGSTDCAYLLVRESRPRGTPHSLPIALVMFTAQFILGLVTSILLTIRAPGTTLCEDFVNLANPCSVALAVTGISWLVPTLVTAGVAFCGMVLSCAIPLHRLYIGLKKQWTPKAKPNEHVFELDNMPSYQPDRRGKEEWTNIPF
ncbi:hypothetical protein C8R43DRAFT_956228 [Mycena crocata]|nr:hypothetical protein C8R43DRAFT_956228 [Mycena crocata]